jgi:hypothetical protein
MSNHYLYIRYHESYKKYNAVKLGITTCIGSRDSSYATGEIKRGQFINVYELTNLSKKYPYSLYAKTIRTSRETITYLFEKFEKLEKTYLYRWWN